MDSAAPIGVFDSGLGGLTVVRRLLERTPAERIMYFADSRYVPYGPRPLEQIRQFALDIGDFLAREGCKMIVMGCNMSSAVALDAVRDRLGMPVLGTIAAGADGALEATRSGRIGVAATEGTVTSGIYLDALRQRRAGLHIVQLACPQFVPIVESGALNGRVAEHVAEQLAPLREADVDTLVLGCTHYPLLLAEIRTAMGAGVTIVDPAFRLAEQTADALRRADLLRAEPAGGGHRFLCSGDPEAFRRGAQTVAGMETGLVEQVDVHEPGLSPAGMGDTTR